MRQYVKAAKMKEFGGDWRLWLMRQWTVEEPKLRAIAIIMADQTLTAAQERVARFAEMGGGSRATFMRMQAEWRKLGGNGKDIPA
jgi:hypothetical protein